MARALTCDLCKKPTREIVGKLFFTPVTATDSRNAFHSRYSHHADVGACCAEKLLTSFDFRQRQSAKEYHASRRRAS